MAIKIRILNDIEASYLAGVIDGEGCFSLFITFFPGETRYGLKAFGQLCIAGTDKLFMEYIAELIGGKIYKIKTKQSRWKDKYQTKIYGDRLRYVIPRVRKYLHCKREQGDLLMAYLDLAAHKGTDSSVIYWQKVLSLSGKMAILNKRGVG